MVAETVEEEMERFPGRRCGYPRDLLRRLGSTSCYEEKEEFVRRDLDEIELSLGLSLGGCFGGETNEKVGLVRTSSIASMSMMGREVEFKVVKGIARASSLPAEAEEELRKRKEIQSLKRMEAKRKRLERMTTRSMVGVGRDRSEESVEEDVERSGVEPGGCLLPALTRWPANDAGGFGPVSQRSIGSQGSCSSVVSELDGRATQGLNSKSAHTTKPRPDGTNHKIATTPATIGGKRVNCRRDGDDPMWRNVRTRNGMSEMEQSMMHEMPCVSTRGDGPDGRRIEGFLYKYRKGEDVRIVCICHGRFLTPAEFVKHAGGGDVTHPLRHIVVSQFPSALL